MPSSPPDDRQGGPCDLRPNGEAHGGDVDEAYVCQAPSIVEGLSADGPVANRSDNVTGPLPIGTPAAEALAANAAVRVQRNKRLRARKSNVEKLTRSLRKKKRRNFQGNVIKGEHEQYTLTIGMMLGIRVAVGRPQQMDDLTLRDFMQVDKYLFPPKGCNKPPHRTPPHHLTHDFKFKDYAPKIFHRVRQLFGIDSASYMLSVSGNYNYFEFMSNSKSGQFFFYSHDGRFMIKTQTPEENKFLRKILPHYYKYVSLNPDTLLTRFYGMHRVKMRHLKRKVHFVIMHSVFDTKEKIFRIYDLKGSTVGRSSGPDKNRKEGVVYKDLDLVDDKVCFQLGTKRKLFMEQLQKDASFLASLNIMDYSLLIGIHDRTRRDESGERGTNLKLDTSVSALSRSLDEPPRRSDLAEREERPAPGLIPRKSTPPELSGYQVSAPIGGTEAASGPCKQPELLEARQEVSYESTSMLEEMPSLDIGECYEGASEEDSDYCSESDSEDDIPLPPSMGRRQSTGQSLSASQMSDPTAQAAAADVIAPVQRSVAGLRGGDCETGCGRLTHRRDHGVQSRLADGNRGNEIYFVGIIDILQQYNSLKRAETFLKSFRYDSRQISAVDPYWYARRFVSFVREQTT